MSRQIGLLALAFTYLIIGGYWINLLSIKKQIDPELSKYYKIFESAVKYNCYSREFEEPSQIIVKFVKNDKSLGSCTYNMFKYVISINETYWVDLDESDRIQLMSHEVLHCLFHEPHVDDISNLMNSEMYTLRIQDTISQTELIIKKNCELWRDYGFIPIKIRN